jgi:hypothetical protein
MRRGGSGIFRWIDLGLRGKNGKGEMKAISDELFVELTHAANAVWNYIASDCLSALAEAGEGDSMSRDDVIEVVCDADRLTTLTKVSPALVAWLDAVDYDVLKRVMRKIFTYKRYA